MNVLLTLESRMRDVEQRLLDACARSGRKREDVKMIAVTKYISAAAASAVVQAGIRHIGENRWPDARDKCELLQGQAVFHYIGTLQTNKVKQVVGRFGYIHSLDRLSLAQAIDKAAQKLGIQVPCFVQVNVSGEASKHGLDPAAVPDFIRSLRDFPGVLPIGFMTMAPLSDDAEKSRPVFRALRLLRDDINKQSLTDQPLKELSMGMSQDFEVAVEEGATWVRLGTVLVGNEQIA